MKETSSGGVVVRNGKVLILKKFRGDWVLPKGRLEEGEYSASCFKRSA